MVIGLVVGYTNLHAQANRGHGSSHISFVSLTCEFVFKTFCATCITLCNLKRSFCHSPTQPQLDLVLDLIMGRNPPHTGTFKALPDNLGS